VQLPANHWYPVLTCREVARKPLGIERLGRRMVFWRDVAWRVHAQDDRCPHMGASLAAGHVEGDCIVCPFHGFRYDGSGRCVAAPALGRHGHIPAALAVRAYPVLERHDLIWMWWGDEPPGERLPPFFPELESGWSHHTTAVDWPVHVTRAIENQLDVSHLAFVHRTTIGKGGRSLVEGPHVEADSTGIRVWATNRRDDGAPARSAAELAAAAAGREPSLHLLYPGIWLLNISPRFKNFIAFVPINDECTRYYLRSYMRLSTPVIAPLLHRLVALSNRFILNQDRRVVVTQPPGSSLAPGGDHLLPTDRAIIAYRQQLARTYAPATDRTPMSS
jgi:phenylpropionate dioxygenase-like ring-hydroxylating dioxygenase large terminal subunit